MRKPALEACLIDFLLTGAAQVSAKLKDHAHSVDGFECSSRPSTPTGSKSAGVGSFSSTKLSRTALRVVERSAGTPRDGKIMQVALAAHRENYHGHARRGGAPGAGVGAARG